MKIILRGASGMVGAGVLREALAASEVDSVLSIGRRPCGVVHPKLRELLLPDLSDFSAVEDQLVGHDACIWAVGISSVGLDEAAYARVNPRGRSSAIPCPAAINASATKPSARGAGGGESR